jgi:hypothetical protein
MTLDEVTLNRYLAQPFARFSEGCRFVCYRSDSLVLKVLRPGAEILRAFESLGTDLGAVTWSPAPGDALASAFALRESAIDSARLAVERLPEETGCLAFGGAGSNIDAVVNVRADPERAAIRLRDQVWVLQHKAQTLRELIASSPAEVATRRLVALVEFIEALWRRGFTDKTFNFLDGYGLIHGKMSLLDVGEISADPEEVARQRELVGVLGSHSFNELMASHPQLSGALREAARAMWPEISANQAIENCAIPNSPLK